MTEYLHKYIICEPVLTGLVFLVAFLGLVDTERTRGGGGEGRGHLHFTICLEKLIGA